MKKGTKLTHGSLIKFLSQTFTKAPDTREKSKINYSPHDTLMSGFACMFFQDASLLEFQRRLEKAERRSNFQTVFNLNQTWYCRQAISTI